MPSQFGTKYGAEVFPALGEEAEKISGGITGEINKRADVAMQQELYRKRMMDLWAERNAGLLERTELQQEGAGARSKAATDERVKALHYKIEGGHQPGDTWDEVLPGNLYSQKMSHLGYDSDGDPIVKPIGLPVLTKYGEEQTAAIPVRAKAVEASAGASVTRTTKETTPKGRLTRAQYDSEVDKLLKTTGRSLLMAKDANDAKAIATQALDDLHNKHNAADGVDDETLATNENALKAKYDDAVSSFTPTEAVK